MDIKDIISKLEKIEQKSYLLENVLSLQAVQAAERTASENAKRVKDSGSTWEKFTGWDPKTAGNVALAKLAQEHNLSGLFNSEGEFVIAYGDKTWSSNPGQAPRTAPPSPDDWNPLAKLGLIPHNAQGPAGLTNFLSGGGAQKEFDAVKQSQPSDDLALDDDEENVTPTNNPQSHHVDNGDETDAKKLADVDALVTQYLSQKKGSEVTSANEGYLDDSLATQLIESFGYVPEAEDLSKPSFGNPHIQAQGEKSRAKSQQGASQAKVSWGNDDGEYTWDDPIITLPDGTVIYDFKDLAFDLGISIAAIGISTITAVPTGGASTVAAGAIVGSRLVKVSKLIKMWWNAFKAPMTVFKDAGAAKSAISTFAKTQLNAFKASVIKALRAFPSLAVGTAGVNWFLSWLGDVLPDDVKDKLMAGVAAVANKIPMPVRQGAADVGDWVSNKLGMDNDK